MANWEPEVCELLAGAYDGSDYAQLFEECPSSTEDAQPPRIRVRFIDKMPRPKGIVSMPFRSSPIFAATPLTPPTQVSVTDSDDGLWVPDCAIEVPPLLKKKRTSNRLRQARVVPNQSPKSKRRAKKRHWRSMNKKPEIVGNTTCCIVGCTRACGGKSKRWHTSLKGTGHMFKNRRQFANLSTRRVAYICNTCYFSDHYEYRKRMEKEEQRMSVD